ncbi:MAG: hypothetical protein ACLSB7_04855 [Parabacteroides distasonis]
MTRTSGGVLAQHMITSVFDALLGLSVVKNNAVSRSMQRMLELLRAAGKDTEY